MVRLLAEANPIKEMTPMIPAVIMIFLIRFSSKNFETMARVMIPVMDMMVR